MSVQISEGLTQHSIINCFMALSNEDVRFVRPKTNLNQVALSIRSNVYLAPPMAVQGPWPISMCQMDEYDGGMEDGFD